MATKKRHRPTTLSLVLIGLMSVSGVAMLTNYVVNSPNSRIQKDDNAVLHESLQSGGKNSDPVIQVDATKSEEADNKVPKKRSAMVSTPHYTDEGDLSFTQKSENVPRGEDPKVFAVNSFLKKAAVTEEGARLLSVSVKDGLATLSFNSKITGGYGADDERTLVNGIIQSLKQFPEIETVEFFADGNKVESFGAIDLSEPQPVNAKPSKSGGARTPL